MEWIIAFLSGAAVVAVYMIVTTALRRRKNIRHVQDAKAPVPVDAHLMPWYNGPQGDPVHLGVVSEEHMPSVMMYHPKTNEVLEYYDCHDEPLREGDHVIRWPNPLTRRVHSLCDEHLHFPDVRKDSYEQDRKPKDE